MSRTLREIDSDTRRTARTELIRDDRADDVAARASTPRQGEHVVISVGLAIQTRVTSRRHALVKVDCAGQQELPGASPIWLRTVSPILKEQKTALFPDRVIRAKWIAIGSTTGAEQDAIAYARWNVCW